ncbi:MAG: hypothetical protein DI582_05895 [Azospirillum brasilense]|nr:MAG: hypothetical protein DI582_05895 [Azospirillum brasilense]
MTTTEPTTDTAGRKGDGIVVLIQNNAARRLSIKTANETACNLLGYADGELNDRDLAEILSPKLAEALMEDLEFDDDAPDVGEMLARQRDFKLRHRMGQELALPFTISRQMAQGHDACFQLVLPNERDNRAQQQLKDFLKLNLEGQQQLDPSTGLPDRTTAEMYLRVLNTYIANNGMQAAFVAIRIDRHEKSLARYGKDACVELIKHVANCCKSTFRTEDVVCALSDHTLGLVLLDVSRESARVVLNRLRWNVRTHRIVFGGKSDFSNTISLSFDMLDQHRGDGLFDRCEEAITSLDKETRNHLIELGQ